MIRPCYHPVAKKVVILSFGSVHCRNLSFHAHGTISCAWKNNYLTSCTSDWKITAAVHYTILILCSKIITAEEQTCKKRLILKRTVTLSSSHWDERRRAMIYDTPMLSPRREKVVILYFVSVKCRNLSFKMRMEESCLTSCASDWKIIVDCSRKTVSRLQTAVRYPWC